MASPQIHIHPLTGEHAATDIANALDLLQRHLPISLPLYRRIQFGRFFDSSYLLSSLSSFTPGPRTNDEEEPYLLAFVDRACRPETEVWMFCSWETEPSPPPPEETVDPAHASLISAFARTLKAMQLPVSMHQAALDAAAPLSDQGAHIKNANIVLCGATHERTAAIFSHLRLRSQSDKWGLLPVLTYIFDFKTLTKPENIETLPPNLYWSHVNAPEHFALVRQRTTITRQDATLAILPNLAIFSEETKQPISWAFTGLDGSLTSLHVEPEFRRQGLAQKITAKLFYQERDMFRQTGGREGSEWAYSFVIEGNEASTRVCESLGAKRHGNVFWVRMDMGALDG